MNRIRALLIDDSPAVLASLRTFLETVLAIEVVGEATHGEDILLLVDELKPDVVVCDLDMADSSGLTIMGQLRERYPQVGRVMLTLHASTEHQKAAFEAGAHAFVSKYRASTALMPAIEEACRIASEQQDKAQANFARK